MNDKERFSKIKINSIYRDRANLHYIVLDKEVSDFFGRKIKIKYLVSGRIFWVDVSNVTEFSVLVSNHENQSE
jgi:hypothetical protein